MDKLDPLLKRWAENSISEAYKSGYSGINIIDKILHDPGISTQGSRHRIHWWPRPKLAKIEKAMHQIPAMAQMCLIIEYGRLIDPKNGQIVTDQDFCKYEHMKMSKYREYILKAKRKLDHIL